MQTSRIVMSALFVVLAMAGFSLFGQGADKAPKQRWEYTIRQSSGISPNILNEAGADGWELVAVSPAEGTPTSNCYFKRSLP